LGGRQTSRFVLRYIRGGFFRPWARISDFILWIWSLRRIFFLNHLLLPPTENLNASIAPSIAQSCNAVTAYGLLFVFFGLQCHEFD
jgi:hypothetical protein